MDGWIESCDRESVDGVGVDGGVAMELGDKRVVSSSFTEVERQD